MLEGWFYAQELLHLWTQTSCLKRRDVQPALPVASYGPIPGIARKPQRHLSLASGGISVSIKSTLVTDVARPQLHYESGSFLARNMLNEVIYARKNLDSKCVQHRCWINTCPCYILWLLWLIKTIVEATSFSNATIASIRRSFGKCVLRLLLRPKSIRLSMPVII